MDDGKNKLQLTKRMISLGGDDENLNEMAVGRRLVAIAS